ncbi:16S rRNA (guanine(527)-N(7))-methyltransferase RsmG [Sphingomonas sp. CGMCC 1.13654]|uniref:Ribosomal RNA small subunit methyltransferase G n=1 Tax=Sphingomonas chungangi TaxID=2683589 RepID=A0A838L8J4_9SPHN|nr:16S rRNA (guanine(527)-N(7))-methyltransferase RsmG [Sphingomonas chungangi]MBA2935504.1 16S rRNA (guanine(527)-N(7))-methyltransferase RsmG [Sphingomonas chungangi]MVW57011.1 16S rRNA (guanine(527)-N(7))-methyltransferase RsmG [Sphingomonas chungangi]
MTDVPRETSAQITTLKALVIAENERQNLVAASTIESFDERHIADSLQLGRHIRDGSLLDIGSGGGFPGLVIACGLTTPVHLVEPRAKRAQFLRDAANALGLSNVVVHAEKVERVALPPVANITARAVANLSTLFTISHHLADEKTRWVLPKGRGAASELEEARRTWQGDFRLVPSVTDAEAAIVIAEGVRRRRTR